MNLSLINGWWMLMVSSYSIPPENQGIAILTNSPWRTYSHRIRGKSTSDWRLILCDGTSIYSISTAPWNSVSWQLWVWNGQQNGFQPWLMINIIQLSITRTIIKHPWPNNHLPSPIRTHRTRRGGPPRSQHVKLVSFGHHWFNGPCQLVDIWVTRVITIWWFLSIAWVAYAQTLFFLCFWDWFVLPYTYTH